MSAWRGLCSLGLGGTAAVLLLTLSPAMVRADGITTFSCTVNGQSNTITTTSSFLPDPIAASSFFGDSEIASTPSSLPASWLGISGSGPVTGSASSPVTAGVFAAGYGDETQLYEQVNNSTTGANPDGSPGAYDAATPGLSSLPSGTVTNLAGQTNSGPGLPYAQVYPVSGGSPDFSSPLIPGGVPTSIYFESYTTNPNAWMPNDSQPTSSCDDHEYAVLDFNVATYLGQELVPGQTYAAYLLVRDTDISGPLANHLWYFQAPAPAQLNTPTLVTTPTPASAAPGTSIHDLATVSGLKEVAGSLPAGDTVSFELVSSCPASGTAPTAAQVVANLGQATATLSPQGSTYTGTATSASFQVTTAGTYYWDVSFSGDSLNSAIAYQCGEAVTVSSAGGTQGTNPGGGGSGGVLGASTSTPNSGADLALPALIGLLLAALGGLLLAGARRLRRGEPA